MTALSLEEQPSRPKTRAGFCSYCLGRIPEGFFFTCVKCGASCCYVHMSRHQPSACRIKKSPRRTRVPILAQIGLEPPL